jgi:hypothetical protein
MKLAVDHIFICTSVGGVEANCLTAFGLIEGAPNTHPGQGTACRRFFFANSYIELLWVNNAAEAQSKAIQPTQLWQRWSGRVSGTCPFGFAFRPLTQIDGEAPFRNWKYSPPYLPAPLCLQVAANADVLTEPLLFCIPFRQQTDRPPVNHPAGLREITRVVFATPYAERLSEEMKAVTDAGLIQLRPGAEYLVELGFDMQSQGQVVDFRPSLPLVFRC